MNVQYINPFIEAFDSFFKEKLKSTVKQGELGVSKGEINVREFAAIVGYGGAVQGIIAMVFPVKTALGIASAIERTQVVVVDNTVTDHLGNIVYAVARDAKAKFPGGENIQQTQFAVMRGSEFMEKYPGGVWLEVPFDTDFGDLKLRVALKAAS